ncbi:MAG: endonuclease/exonuclease/phosphatase family protein [Blastocatellia bacterium]|nr:endonuclease/exonuclease/phosphatase family protein [Blastocatellia bacterium]
MKNVQRLRVATYNIHKCRGLDRRRMPSRIVEVLREIDADIVGLQEVLSIPDGSGEDDQARFIADELGMHVRVGENRRLNGGAYGNVVLSRYPIVAAYNYDISITGREPRGCQRVDVALGHRQVLHLYNAHLGTSYFERRRQGRRLLEEEILRDPQIPGPRILLGDFNEWTSGLASRLLAEHFRSADLRLHLPSRRTYPGVMPLIHLDHIYFDEAFELETASLHRSRLALVASDHLPIVAEFRYPAADSPSSPRISSSIC